MKWFNQIRLKQVLTFPVETFAMVHNGDDIIDQNYKQFCAEMYAEGHSFFTYISDSADSLASCCRLRNELAENTFSPTSGLTGVMTGSCNVITLNINRIVQDWALTHTLNGAPLIKGKQLENIGNPLRVTMIENDLKNYLVGILKESISIILLSRQCYMTLKTRVCLPLQMAVIFISANYTAP